jgi:hypothetical protein
MLTLPARRHWLFASERTNQGLVFSHAQSWVTWLDDAWWLFELERVVDERGRPPPLGAHAHQLQLAHRLGDGLA